MRAASRIYRLCIWRTCPPSRVPGNLCSRKPWPPIRSARRWSSPVSICWKLWRVRHQAFRPTALESYLQCAFQFFGRDTLRLKAAPARPEKRLGFLTQGSVVHSVLAALSGTARPFEEVFDSIFAQICQKQYVPPGYHTEACRLRMLSDLRALIDDTGWNTGYPVRTEQKFRYRLIDGVEISGRIDRIDLTPDGGAYVIDYKYSGAQNTRNLATNENLLQAQLYLLALERFFELRPEGMSYWGFKGGIKRTPWAPFEPARAIETALRIVGEIRAGRVEPGPADASKCRFCDFRDVCRFTAAAPALAEDASSWD